MTSLPASYVESRRYESATIQHQQAEQPVPCPLQPRDVAIVNDVRRYRFLTGRQLRELWWPAGGPRAAQRRLRKLFEAGYLDRFRPLSYRGSYPWTYHLSAGGHQLLQRAGFVDRRQRFHGRTVYDYSYVVHDLQLNSWVLAYRRGLGDQLISWDGETEIYPPDDLSKGQLKLGGNWTADGLRDPRPRLVRPDAVLELDGVDGEPDRTILVEYDRTRRIDKNYEKFRRYDSFLTWWWHHSVYADRSEPPFVLFICQDAEQRDQFLEAADRELTGHCWHRHAKLSEREHPGRRHIVFAVEMDAHSGHHQALRVPAYPPGHSLREAVYQRVRLPGGGAAPDDTQRELQATRS